MTTLAAFLAALITYVALGVLLKSVVLNWLVGPAYLVIVLYLLPAAVRHLRDRGRVS